MTQPNHLGSRRFALAFGLTLVPAGRLGGRVRAPQTVLIGLLLFAVTGLICGAAPNAVVLIIGRLLRGVAAACSLRSDRPVAADVLRAEAR